MATCAAAAGVRAGAGAAGVGAGGVDNGATAVPLAELSVDDVCVDAALEVEPVADVSGALDVSPLPHAAALNGSASESVRYSRLTWVPVLRL